MNSPNLPEKNESFTPLSLDRLMKLKEEIFEEVLRVEDKSKQWLYISYIWLGSLDDARELCCNLEDPIERFFFDIVECTDCLRVKYSDILEPLFGERYNKIPKNYIVPWDKTYAYETRDWYGKDLQWPLKDKIDLYYSQFIARKKLSSTELKYTDSLTQYNLELLLEQMLNTKLYDLKGVQSSLALVLHGAVHVNKNTGKEAFFTHGEAEADKLTHYLINKIESLLPEGYQLEGNENSHPLIKKIKALLPGLAQVEESKNTPYRITRIDGWDNVSPDVKRFEVDEEVVEFTKNVYLGDNLRMVKDKNGLKWAVDNTGKLVVDFLYTYFTTNDSNESYYSVTTPAQERGIIDWQGNVALRYSPVYSYMEVISWDRFIVQSNGDYNFSLVGTKWYHEVIAGGYSQMDVMENGYIEVEDKNGWGVIDTNGKTILPCIYNSLECIKNGSYITSMEMDEKRFENDLIDKEWKYIYGVLSRASKQRDGASDYSSSQIVELENDYFAILEEGKRWVVDSHWYSILTPKYDSILPYPWVPEWLRVQQEGKWMIRNTEDKYSKTLLEFDEIVPISQEIMWVKYPSTYGKEGQKMIEYVIYDLTTGKVRPTELYQEIEPLGNGFSKVGKKSIIHGWLDRWVIDEKWNTVIICGCSSIELVWDFLITIVGTLQKTYFLYDLKWNELMDHKGYKLILPIKWWLFRVQDFQNECFIINPLPFKVLTPNITSGQANIIYEDGQPKTAVTLEGRTLVHYPLDGWVHLSETLDTEVAALNLISGAKIDPIVAEDYLYYYGPNNEYRRRKNNYAIYEDDNEVRHISHDWKAMVNLDIGRHPEKYIAHLTAKAPSAWLANTISAVLQKSRERWENSNIHGSLSHLDQGMNYHAEELMWGGSNIEGNEKKLQIKFDHPVSNFLTTGIYERYTSWRRHSLESWYTRYTIGTLGDNTGHIEITDPQARTIALPVQTNNYEISNVYVKIQNGGRKELLITTQPEGVYTVDLPANSVELKISFANGLFSNPIPSNISNEQYTAWVKTAIAGKENPFSYQYAVPTECEIFLDEIKHLSPKERVIKCETFVRQYMRYDYINSNSDAKAGKPLEEQIRMCMQQKSIMMQQRPDQSSELWQKLFVGVCADAATLLYALLCRAWILCGNLGGFMSTPTGRGLHARNYVLFPGEKNEPLLYEVDGTPDNCAWQTPSIEQHELAIAQEIEQLEAQGIKLHTSLTNIESSQVLAKKQQQSLNDLETTISWLLEMYYTQNKDELIAAAIEQKINQLPVHLQSERWEKYKQSKAA